MMATRAECEALCAELEKRGVRLCELKDVVPGTHGQDYFYASKEMPVEAIASFLADGRSNDNAWGLSVYQVCHTGSDSNRTTFHIDGIVVKARMLRPKRRYEGAEPKSTEAPVCSRRAEDWHPPFEYRDGEMRPVVSSE